VEPVGVEILKTFIEIFLELKALRNFQLEFYRTGPFERELHDISARFETDSVAFVLKPLLGKSKKKTVS